MNEPDELPELPGRLALELKALHGPPVRVPSVIEQQLHAEAEAHLKRRATPKLVVLFPRWLAAAAALIAFIGLATLLFWSSRDSVDPRLDVNRDGRFDVLDAFSLARRLQQGGTLDPLLDINGDGVVDARDVETLTARAVRLTKEKGQG